MKKILAPILIILTMSSAFAAVDAELANYFKQIDPTYKTPEERKQGYFARTITIDTRDQEVCLYIEDGLKKAGKIPYREDICTPNEETPFTSVVIFIKSNDKYDPGIHLSELNVDPRLKDLARNYKGLSALSALTSLAIFVLPESVSKWDRDKILKGNISRQWLENVSGGPVIDEDPWPVNYIGHPLTGAAYYTVSRHAGFSRLESFGISVLLSTFYWEYGLEAASEPPSLQDLIITPIIGSLMGEAFMYIEEKIDENDGEIYGSKSAGDIFKVLIDPIGSMTDYLENELGVDNLDVVATPILKINDSNSHPDYERDKFFAGLNIEIRF